MGYAPLSLARGLKRWISCVFHMCGIHLAKFVRVNTVFRAWVGISRRPPRPLRCFAQFGKAIMRVEFAPCVCNSLPDVGRLSLLFFLLPAAVLSKPSLLG